MTEPDSCDPRGLRPRRIDCRESAVAPLCSWNAGGRLVPVILGVLEHKSRGWGYKIIAPSTGLPKSSRRIQVLLPVRIRARVGGSRFDIGGWIHRGDELSTGAFPFFCRS